MKILITQIKQQKLMDKNGIGMNKKTVKIVWCKTEVEVNLSEMY